MQKIIALLLVCALLSFNTGNGSADRKKAIKYFKETERQLQKEIAGLTEIQLNWKPADSVWSISNCVEHIAISEKNLFDWAMSTLKEPVNPVNKEEKKMTDEGVIKMMKDRSFKAKAAEEFKPSGQFGNTAASMKVFKQRRSALINYMKNTKDDLRNHSAATPLGVVDTYQVLLLLAGHSERHTLQIAALKAMPGFPNR